MANAARQPTVSSRYCDSGQNTVLAKPPNNVNAVTARRYDWPAIWCSVANAGSYRQAAIATPASSQPTASITGPCATANTTQARPASSEPAASTRRPPWASICRPTMGDTRPDTNNPAVKLPNSHSSPVPVAIRIAVPSTAIV